MRIFYALLALAVCSSCNVEQENQSTDLTRAVQEKFDSVEGDFALALITASGEKHFINEQESFHAASTMKTPVMIEVYRQAAEGNFSLDDSLTIKNQFISIVDGTNFSLDVDRDGGEALYEAIGEKRTIRDLVYDMIIYSSNLATNIVIELVDGQSVTRTMRNAGAEKIAVLRGVEDMKAFDAGLSNTTTAKDLAIIYDKLAKKEWVDETASQTMIEILFDQQYNEIIPAHLPDDVKVAHKTGFIDGVHHDSGIVFLPDGRHYVLVLLSKNMTDSDRGTAMLANVSKHIYDYITADDEDE